ncbi:hypothetical protein OC842_005254 [Tilletia horrida]|uniref:Pentatricopeptide repeat-containing protein-mitochondrial domain-containing protein n=1 Tax=Tilletia horrida TaxID=155126 RepID=A0AAN6GAN7_9BASI|nr:hypothetical protein OC842_005254 [Tilletia horrida]KAK0563531.1 hypothetical protein OC844_002163 [Tilletia horrida]
MLSRHATAAAALVAGDGALAQLLPPLAPAFFRPDSGSCSRSSRRTFTSTAAQWAEASSLAKPESADGDEQSPSQSRASAPGSKPVPTWGAVSGSDSIYPSSQAALRPNPYSRSPLYRHTRANPNESSDRSAPKGVLEPPPVARLNEALRLAISQGDEEAVANILDKFEQLVLDGDSRKGKRKSVLPISAESTADTITARLSTALLGLPAPLLSYNLTRNWSPVTYHHILTYCVNTSRVELALAALGSAYHRACGNLEALSAIFPASASGSLIRVLVNVGEARLAYELARWLNSGEAPLVKRSHWFPILTACAKYQYLPGIIGAWNRTLKNGNDLVDEGLVLQILSAAARIGDVDFCMKVLRRAISGSASTHEVPQLVLHQGLLAPLFEAFCASFDFEAAIRFLSRMQAAGMDFKRHAATPLSNAIAAALTQHHGDRSASNAVGEQIIAALRNVGSAFVENNLHNKLAGIHVSAYNAVIIGAIWAKRVDLAHEIYKLRSELLGIEDGAARSFTLDEFLVDSNADGEVHPTSTPEVIAERLNQQRLLPNLDTFHALISACADTGEIRLARKLLQDLNGFNLEPSAETYQRLVKLCLACAPRVYERQRDEAARAQAEAGAERAAYADRPFGAQTMAAATRPGTTSASSSAPEASPPWSRPGAAGPIPEPSYTDAFKLLDECKKRKLKPTQATYEAIVWRCWREHDPRWHDVYQEMKQEADYVPSWALLNALQPGFRALRREAEAEEEEEREERSGVRMSFLGGGSGHGSGAGSRFGGRSGGRTQGRRRPATSGQY